MKTCKNCAWYCHGDGRCYAHELERLETFKGYVWHTKQDWSFEVKDSENVFCSLWTFDGLEEWEREDSEKTHLMAMEQ